MNNSIEQEAKCPGYHITKLLKIEKAKIQIPQIQMVPLVFRQYCQEAFSGCSLFSNKIQIQFISTTGWEFN